MTRENYQANRDISKAHGADIWPPYKDLVSWRNQYACPHSITAISRDEVVVSWQDVVDHQWEYRLEKTDDTEFQNKVLGLVEDGYKLLDDWKFGFDSANLFKGFNFSDPSRHRGLNSLNTTSAIPVQLLAEKDMGSYVMSQIVWQNPMVNSPYGICILRQSYENESHGMYL